MAALKTTGIAGASLLLAMALTAQPALAADAGSTHDGGNSHVLQRITLNTDRVIDCVQVVDEGERVRLYTSDQNYLDVLWTQIKSTEAVTINTPPQSTPANSMPNATAQLAPRQTTPFTREQLHPMLAEAGTAHNIDADLLWSVVHAESAGNPRAVSRVGAQGLMQLMPGTASTLGVKDSFAPKDNIAGGAAYLDQLLVRYHDDMTLALAAYNAGPEAVDRYHGIPPYRETRAYVARVIAEFNRRKRALMAANVNTPAPATKAAN